MLLCSIFRTSYSTLPAKTYPCIPVPVRQAAWAAVSTHFWDAQLKPGIELFFGQNSGLLQKRLRMPTSSSLEKGNRTGRLLWGKVPSGILQEARRQRIPVILLAGAIEDAGILNAVGFRGVFSITPSPVSLEQAMQPEFAQEKYPKDSGANLPDFLLTLSNSFNIPIAPDTDYIGNQPADGDGPPDACHPNLRYRSKPIRKNYTGAQRQHGQHNRHARHTDGPVVSVQQKQDADATVESTFNA